MKLTLVVSKKVALTDAITEFTLIAPAGKREQLPAYTAGAHIDFDLGETIGTRSYSLIDWSAPPAAPTHYTVAVQREDNGDGGSQRMHALNVGDEVTTTVPDNDFELHDSAAPALLIAGGIGITPLISMAAACRDQDRAFHIRYAGRSQSVMAYTDKLKSGFDGCLDVHADDKNPLPLDTLFDNIAADTQIYLCGPSGLIDAARTAATAAGVANEQIHVELFATPQAQADDAAFEVELSGTGEVHVVPAGHSIIDVLEAAGHDLIYDCQRGDCGICQTTVISGTPDHRDVVLSDQEKAAGNVMQICVSRAKSERLVLEL